MAAIGKLLHTYIHTYILTYIPTYIHTGVVCLFKNTIQNQKGHRNPFQRVSVSFFAFFQEYMAVRKGGHIYD